LLGAQAAFHLETRASLAGSGKAQYIPLQSSEGRKRQFLIGFSP
jgi:hypothetical protein